MDVRRGGQGYWAYGLTVFLGASLLFAVEPMAAKILLPVLGGSSAVWLASLCFFQCVLLLGYGYAYLLAGWGVGRERLLGAVHCGLLMAGVVSLVGLRGGLLGRLGWATQKPAAAVFVGLAGMVGLPFLLLSATSPLLQVWAARRSGGGVPYRMFALSNVGSLLALVAYPVAIEPYLTLGMQRAGWAVGFAVYAGMCGWLAVRGGGVEKQVFRFAEGDKQEDESRKGESRRGESRKGESRRSESRKGEGRGGEGRRSEGREGYGGGGGSLAEGDEGEVGGGVRGRAWVWFGLGAAAATQLCAVTSHLTVNVAAIPLLWVAPLAVYLVSFVLAFEFPGVYRRGVVVRVLVVMLASLGYLLSKTDVSLPIGMSVGFFLLELLFACWFCHAEVYALRPRSAGSGEASSAGFGRLGERLGISSAAGFYLVLSAGGAAGTMFVAVVSPLVFRANYDLPMAFAMTAAMALAVTWEDGWPQRLLWGVSTVLCCALVGMLYNGYRMESMLNVRNFYGSLRVRQSDQPEQAGTSRVLLHGSIRHGMQWFAEEYRREPTTYYARDSGVGLVLGYCCEGRGRRIGVIGLGVGTMAAYGRDGDAIEFYEINPLMEGIARGLFTYLRESKARVTVVEGDARVSLAKEAPQGFDVLVVDAFSGDAIPVHLLTLEALREYRRHMAPGGVIAFHVSNQYLDLSPVLGNLARAAGMEARVVDSPGREDRGEFAARWVLLADAGAGDGLFARKEFRWAAEGIPERAALRVWTDDYSSLLPIVRWGRGGR